VSFGDMPQKQTKTWHFCDSRNKQDLVVAQKESGGRFN